MQNKLNILLKSLDKYIETCYNIRVVKNGNTNRIGANNMDDNNVYIENGYESREDYLQCMSDEYGVSIETVYTLADLLEGEEFDGLISALEDAENMDW